MTTSSTPDQPPDDDALSGSTAAFAELAQTFARAVRSLLEHGGVTATGAAAQATTASVGALAMALTLEFLEDGTADAAVDAFRDLVRSQRRMCIAAELQALAVALPALELHADLDVRQRVREHISGLAMVIVGPFGSEGNG